MDLQLQIATAAEERTGRVAFGLVVFDQASARPVHEAAHVSEHPPGPAAEFDALNRALELAAGMAPAQLEIRCASAKLIEAVTGASGPASADAEPLHEQVLGRLLRLDSWRMSRLDPEQERRAPELARTALEAGTDVVELDRAESPKRQKREHTGVPQWTVELLDEPGEACPAQCAAHRKYAFGPDTPGGFCVHATSVALLDGPLNWSDPDQRRMSTHCPHCHTPLRIERVE